MLLFLVGSISPGLIKKTKRARAPGFTAAHYHHILAIVPNAAVMVTTPHILTEVSNLSGKEKHFRQHLRGALKKLIVDRLVEEPVTATVAVGDVGYIRLGLTDAAITRLSQQSQGLVVLTSDGTLARPPRDERRGSMAAAAHDSANDSAFRSTRSPPATPFRELKALRDSQEKAVARATASVPVVADNPSLPTRFDPQLQPDLQSPPLVGRYLSKRIADPEV